jgi:hypothetical protein
MLESGTITALFSDIVVVLQKYTSGPNRTILQETIHQVRTPCILKIKMCLEKELQRYGSPKGEISNRDDIKMFFQYYFHSVTLHTIRREICAIYKAYLETNKEANC